MFDLNDDEFILAKVSPFKDTDRVRGKSAAIAISFSWIDCLQGTPSQDASIGLPITLRNYKLISHDNYIHALVDLLSRSGIKRVKFILAGELQWSNLLHARNHDVNQVDLKEQALEDLFRLEKMWLKKFRPLIEEKLVQKGIVVSYYHWRDLRQDLGCQEQTRIFNELKKNNNNVKSSLEKEINSALKREANKGRTTTAELVQMYLDEEIPVFMNHVSPSCPDKIDYFLYPARVDVMVNTFNALERGHGIWEEIHMSIKTKQDMYNRWKSSTGKNQIIVNKVLTPGEGVAGITIEQLESYVQKEFNEQKILPKSPRLSPLVGFSKSGNPASDETIENFSLLSESGGTFFNQTKQTNIKTTAIENMPIILHDVNMVKDYFDELYDVIPKIRTTLNNECEKASKSNNYKSLLDLLKCLGEVTEKINAIEGIFQSEQKERTTRNIDSNRYFSFTSTP